MSNDAGAVFNRVPLVAGVSTLHQFNSHMARLRIEPQVFDISLLMGN